MIFSDRFQSGVADFKPVEFDGFNTQAAFFDLVAPTVRKFRIVRSEASVVRRNRTTASRDARKFTRQPAQQNTTHLFGANRAATRLTEAVTCKRYLQVGKHCGLELNQFLPFDEREVLPNAGMVRKKAENRE